MKYIKLIKLFLVLTTFSFVLLSCEQDVASDNVLDENLVGLIDTLNNNFTEIEKVLDVDRALWMLAYHNVLVNLDSYSGAFQEPRFLACETSTGMYSWRRLKKLIFSKSVYNNNLPVCFCITNHQFALFFIFLRR